MKHKIKPKSPPSAACLALLLLSPGLAKANLLISENFNYPAGAAPGVPISGVGLSGNWMKANLGGSEVSLFSSSSLTIPGHFASSGGYLEVNNNAGPNYGEGGAAATLAVAIPTVDTLWRSSIIQIGASTFGGNYYTDWVAESRFNTGADSAYGTSTGRVLGRVYGSTGADGRAGVSSNGSEVYQTTGTISPETNYLMVTKYGLSGTDFTSATLFAFSPTNYANYLAAANADPASAEALLTTNADFTLMDSDTGSFGAMTVLQFTVNGGSVSRTDDFRLGTALTDVVNVVPESSTAFLSVLTLSGLTLIRRRK